ncbi:MAG: antitoxin Xre-like helix-turn-helix domain-containing protein [Burkholderiaceae bacterium]
MESTIGDKRKPVARKPANYRSKKKEYSPKDKDWRHVKDFSLQEKELGAALTISEILEPLHANLARFKAVYLMDPVERIDLIKEGIEPQVFTTIAKSMRRSKESFSRLMGMPATTVSRKLQKHEPFSIDDSERLVATAKLIGQVENMVQESGDPDGFDAAQWFNQWLDKPLHALNNRPPADFMTTAEGRDLLSQLLASAQSGAYV